MESVEAAPPPGRYRALTAPSVREVIDSPAVELEVRQPDIASLEADLLVVGLYDGEQLPAELAGAPGAADADGRLKRTAMLLPDRPPRVLAIGLGGREDTGAERFREIGARAAKKARELELPSLALLPPDSEDPEATAAALVTGAVLANHRFDRFKRREDGEEEDAPRLLTMLVPAELEPALRAAHAVAAAQNRARELQSLPSNFATPAHLAERAEAIAAEHAAVSAEVLGREEIAAKGMGGLASVSRGSAEEPRLIVLRYRGGTSGPTLGLVGKGVTFDTGGISLKPGAGMHEMKMDMSGAAAVLEAVAAIAELELPLELLAVVPATENMPSGTAIKPGDVITQYGGTTVEVLNTDAEGRLILADALAYARELGAERIVDLATLTGAVTIALGSTYAALVANDDELAGAVLRAGEETGELTWRLPLHPEYKRLMKGKVADLSNMASQRKAGTIAAASFLEEFVGDTPWAHVDIAGTAWDVGREYTGKDASGFGVRLLVELARDLAG